MLLEVDESPGFLGNSTLPCLLHIIMVRRHWNESFDGIIYDSSFMNHVELNNPIDQFLGVVPNFTNLSSMHNTVLTHL